MATYYVDYGNGSDAAAGTSWGTAWKTIRSGATAARTTGGDVIRVAKSPDPVSIGNVTWTHDSHYITAASSVATLVDDCETGWTSGVATTTIVNTHDRLGSFSTQFASTTSTGKLGYKNLGSTRDYSAFQRITFWFRASSNVTVSSSNLKLCLCSDTAGDTIVDEFVFPTGYYKAQWMPFTIDKGSALGSSIQSIALYATVNASSLGNLGIDDISVTGAASSGSSLCLNDVIAKGDGTSEGWYAVKALNGTQIYLTSCRGVDSRRSQITASGAKYRHISNTSETVETYKRTTIPTFTHDVVTGNTAIFGLNENNATTRVTFSGGWNTSTNERDGETWFDGINEQGYCWDLSNFASGLSVDRMGFVRYGRVLLLGASTKFTLTNCYASSPGSAVANCASNFYADDNNEVHFKSITQGSNQPLIQLDGRNQAVFGYDNTFKIDVARMAGTVVSGLGGLRTKIIVGSIISDPTMDSGLAAIHFGSTNADVSVQVTGDVVVLGSGKAMLTPLGSSVRARVRFDGNITCASGPLIDAAVGMVSASDFRITFDPTKTVSVTNIAKVGHSEGVVTSVPGFVITNMSYTASSSDLAVSSGIANPAKGQISLVNYDGVVGSHRTYLFGGGYANYVRNVDTPVHTSGGKAWEICLANTLPAINEMPLATVAVKADKEVTFKVWVRRSATGGQCRLGYRQNGAIGFVNETATEITEPSVNTWEENTITATPTEDGVIEFFADVKYISGLCSYYFDDITITQAD